MFLYDSIDFKGFDNVLGRYRRVFNSEDNEIGIEIEFSGHRPFPELKSFERTTDGSVRGDYSGEYVLYQPCSMEALPTILDELNTVHPIYDYDEKSTSVHIHMNMQDSKIEHIVNTAALYFMFEASIMREFCKESRRKNHFCLGLFDAPYLFSILHSIVNKTSLSFLSGEDIKYSSVNFQCLPTFGTLEFRSLHGTADKKEIFEWVSLLKRIKTLASQYTCEEFIVEALTDFKGMANVVFGKEVDIDESLVREVIFELKPALLSKIKTRRTVKLIEPRKDV